MKIPSQRFNILILYTAAANYWTIFSNFCHKVFRGKERTSGQLVPLGDLKSKAVSGTPRRYCCRLSDRNRTARGDPPNSGPGAGSVEILAITGRFDIL